MVSALVDLDCRRVDVEPFEKLAQHFTLGGDELGMEFTFDGFEVFTDQRACSKHLDLLAQVFKGACASFGGVGAMRGDMKYWHWGSPP